MKKLFFIVLLFFFFSLSAYNSSAQCSICTRTAQQLGSKPAAGLNSGILYLAFTPFAVAALVGYRWWRNNKES
jgi:hypothetical protein